MKRLRFMVILLLLLANMIGVFITREVKMHKVFLVLLLFFSIISSLVGCASRDPLTDTVIKADLIVLGTITDNRTEVVTIVSENSTGKYAYTLFTLSIEKVIKGDPSIKEAIIREECGYIGDGVYQWSTACVNFRISDHVLVGLIREDDVYILFAAPYGELGMPTDSVNSIFWIQSRELISSSPLEEIMGRICKILRINRIPVSLNEPCPEPAYEPASPPKQ